MVWKFLSRMLPKRQKTETKLPEYPKVVQLPNGKWACITQEGAYLGKCLHPWVGTDYKLRHGMHSYSVASEIRENYLSTRVRA